MLQGVASYELHPCQTEHAFLITGEFLGKKSIPRKLITKLAQQLSRTSRIFLADFDNG